MGAAAEAHPPVFPDRRLRLHGIVQGVGLQAPLERRAVRPPAGRPNGHPGGEWRVPSCFSGGLGWVIGCKHEFRKWTLFMYLFKKDNAYELRCQCKLEIAPCYFASAVTGTSDEMTVQINSIKDNWC